MGLKDKARRFFSRAVDKVEDAARDFKSTVLDLRATLLGASNWLPDVVMNAPRLVGNWIPPKSLADGGTPVAPVDLTPAEKEFIEKMGVFSEAAYGIFRAEYAMATGAGPAEAVEAASGLDLSRALRLGDERYTILKLFHLPVAPGFAFSNGQGPTGAALFKLDGTRECKLVLAFRGTVPNGPGELEANTDVTPAPCALGEGCYGTLHGGLQNHFRSAYEGQVMGALEAVDAACAGAGGWELAVTGHSLGGAMAQLHEGPGGDVGSDARGEGGARRASLPNLKGLKAVTFGQWAAGDAAFARFFADLTSAAGDRVSFDRVLHYSKDGTFPDWVRRIRTSALCSSHPPLLSTAQVGGSTVVLTTGDGDAAHTGVPLVHVGRDVPILCPRDAPASRCPVLKRGEGFYDKSGARKGALRTGLVLNGDAKDLHNLRAYNCDMGSKMFASAYGAGACGRLLKGLQLDEAAASSDVDAPDAAPDAGEAFEAYTWGGPEGELEAAGLDLAHGSAPFEALELEEACGAAWQAPLEAPALELALDALAWTEHYMTYAHYTQILAPFIYDIQ
eukprot:tig00000655_g2856.t1